MTYALSQIEFHVVSEVTKLRELHAAACIRAALNVEVRDDADDGTLPRMYDLEIRYTDRPWAPAEVTSHLDEPTESVLAQISANDGGVWSAPTLNLRWSTNIRVDAKVKRLRRALEPALARAEAAGLDQVNDPVIRQLRRDVATASDAEEKLAAALHLADLGVSRARASIPDPEGAEIWVSAGSGGGAWARTGEPIVGWLDAFIRDPKRADLVRKHTHLTYDEAHIFIFVDINAVDYAVFRALTEDDVVPEHAPQLPTPFTHAWVVGAGAATGVRWDPDIGWRRFDRRPSLTEG